MLRRQVTFAHKSYVFNEHLDANGAVDPTKVKNTVVLDGRENPVAFRDLRDPYHLAQGGSLGRVHKGFLDLNFVGRIEVPDATQQASLADREWALRAAFDPYLCLLDSPSTDGAYALDFFEPTLDTTTYPTGWVPLRYWARPTRQPRVQERLASRTSLPFGISLTAPDPRAYEQTEQTLVLSPGSASGNVVNRGTVPAPLKATIVTTAAGASNFTIARGGVSFILDLSGIGSGAHTIIVVMETCAPYGEGRKITLDGARKASLKTSSPATWLDVPPGTTSFTISNHTNVTTCTLGWWSARA
jgi:hypothetical protein